MMNYINIASVKIIICVVAGFLLIHPGYSVACPIPVFRYALEYWETDQYNLEIIYENSLSPEEEELVNYLQRALADSEINANIEVRKTDAEGNFENIAPNYLKDQTAGIPLMVLRYPRISGNNRVIWSGPLNKHNIDLVLHSPVREMTGQKLVQDATAVWLLLESGDRRKDREALELLEKELGRLEQTLVLPDRQLWLEANEEFPAIKFETVKISRNDPQEEHLVKMLLSSEEDLNEFETEPIVFPVYGRGIVLYGIVGKGINEWNIREAAAFLTGPCSCQAKMLNPGTDLLMSMDWKRLVKNLSDINIANPLSGMGDFSNREEEARRLLESATARRLGPGAGNADNQDTEAEKVVYLDIFGSNKQDVEAKGKDIDKDRAYTRQYRSGTNEVTIAESVNDKTLTGDNQEENPDVVSFDEKAKTESQKVFVDSHRGRTNFTSLALAFGGVVLMIFLGGIILYLKTSKK